MKDQELDKIVEKWVDDETSSAPKLRPTSEMYEQVVSLGRRYPLGLFLARRPIWATVLAAVVILVLTYAVVQLSPLVAPIGGRQVAQVPQRPAFVAEKAPQRGEAPPKGKRPSGGAAVFSTLVFQVRGRGSAAVRSVDAMAPQLSRVKLTADDSYRLVLEPAADRHVYVYQQSPSGTLAALYPNEAYGPAQNPARAGETIYLPAEPDGFYVERGEGVIRLYVVAAEEPVPELEALYERYSGLGLRWERRKALALLQEQLDALVAGQVEGASGWTFEFEVQ